MSNTASTNDMKKVYDSGSLRKKKMNSKVMALDKLKGFSTGGDRESKNLTNEKNRAQSVGKNTLKNLGFKMSKGATLNFYEGWKFEEYPETVVSVFDTFMKSVGVGMVQYGADEDDWMGNFMGQLHNQLTENSKHYSTLIPKNNRKLMKNVLSQIEELLAAQQRIQSVVIIQSLIRRRLAKKRVSGWIVEEGVAYTKTRRHESNVAFRDVLSAEELYIKSLERIVNNYLIPLRKMSEAKRTSIDMSSLLQGFQHHIYLSKEDLEAIFSNVEVLLNVHKKIYQKFQNLREKWPYIDTVGATFLRIAPDLISYGDYVRNLKNSMDTIIRLQEQDLKFRAFLEESALQSGADLMGLIIRPLNHIFHYSRFLKIVVNNTPSTDPDLEPLRNAYISVKKTGKFIQDSYRGATNRAKIADIQRRMVLPKGVNFELAIPKRQFVVEGAMNAVEKTLGFNTEKSRAYFLFNDVFLVAEESGKQLKIHHIHLLKETTIDDMNVPNAFQFGLSSSTDGKVIYAMKTKEEKIEILKKLKDNIENQNINQRVFGVPLAKLLEREKPIDGIPFVVKSCIEFLRKKREMEGIFRISGSTGEVTALKQLFNKTVEPPTELMDLKNYNPYSVAALLKMFFRELPEPIYTFSTFKPLTNITIDEKNPKVTASEVKKVVTTIPQANQMLLKYLSGFLISVARFGSVNKMNLTNISIVFGPNLLFPQEESLETILLIPRLNLVFQFIFEHFAEIFGDVNTN